MPQFHPDHPRTGPATEYRDRLTAGPLRGRGAGLNPGNRFETVRLHIMGEHLDERAIEAPTGVQIPTQVFDDDSRTIINHFDSPDLHMKWSVNPYRGCEHGCIYCFARPGHEFFGLSLGVDFETRIYVKRRAAELLRRELDHPRWAGQPLSMSNVTDCYQPIERELKITRACLQVMADRRQPVGIITKNSLVTRDIDLLRELARHDAAHVAVSITTLDNALAVKMEPRASSPRDRLETVRKLSESGIPVAVMVAPIIPGLTDHEIPGILEAASKAGARTAGYVMLRLPHQIKDLFIEWLGRHFPDRAARVESLVREMHGGELYNAQWHTRMTGVGPYAEQINSTFALFSKRFGLDRKVRPLSSTSFIHGSSSGQGMLYSQIPEAGSAGDADQPSLLD
ncbi:MAG: PA0069 family radical SAM protein [Phycisphaerales bacterium]|nr:PA0069 family radical SAM protein [Phycisphaerales bacterium]